MTQNPPRRRSAFDSTSTESFPRNLPNRQRSSPAILARLRSNLSNRSVGTTTDNVSHVAIESTVLLGHVVASDDNEEATTPSSQDNTTTNRRQIGILSLLIAAGALSVVVSASSLVGDSTTNLVSDRRVEEEADAASLQLDLFESSPTRSSVEYHSHTRQDNEEDDDEEDSTRDIIIEKQEDNEEDGEEKENEEEEDNDEAPPRDINIQPNASSSLIAQQFTNDPYAHRSKMEMILMGKLGLVGIRYSPNSFAKLDSDGDAKDDEYANVYGDFCVFNPHLNKEDPSYYPTIKDAMAESSHCSEHRYTLPLNEVMFAIQNANAYGKNSKSNNKSGVMRSSATNSIISKVRTLPLTGLLFHQGHAGSGLLANILSYAYDSTHVISKHPALRDALSACDVIRNRYRSGDNCSEDKRRRLIRDVITLLSRTSDDGNDDITEGDTTGRVEHLFLRLDGASTAYLPDLRSMYPNVKWTFSYRNSEETLSKTMHRHRESHNNNNSNNNSSSSALVPPPPPCAKSKRNPTTNLLQKSQQHNVELEGLNHYQVCALHLSTLLDVALEEHERSSGGGSSGLLVSYEDVVKTSGRVFVDEVLPYFGLKQDDKLRKKKKSSIHNDDNDKDLNMDRVTEILSTRSNSRGQGKERGWDKSMEEDVVISEEVREAVKLFM